MARRPRAVAGAVLLCALLAAPMAGAAEDDAAPTAEELGLEVVVGYDGRQAGGVWSPVEVALAPRRAIAGAVVVESSTDGGPVREQRAIEVAAGSRKVYRFLVPTGSVRVLVQEAGRDPLTVREPFGGPQQTFLVGVLGAVPADAPPLRSEQTGENGAWVALDPAWAELHALALSPLAALVATETALTDLSPSGRSHVAEAVAQGLDLVVVAEGTGPPDLAGLGLPRSPVLDVTTAPAPPEALAPNVVVPAPEAWGLPAAAVAADGTPDPVAAAVQSGRGRIATSAVPLGESTLGQNAAYWNELVGPNPRVGAENTEWAVTRYPWQFSRLLQEEGAGAPEVPWLAAFIAGYVFVVGPVNGLVLSRLGRRELAWVTVPLVTAVFTAGAFLGATGGRPPVGLGARAVYWIDGQGAEIVAAGARAPTPGVHDVRFVGEGWQVRPMVDGGQPATVVTGGDGVVARFDLTALQLGGAIGWRDIDEPAPLAVSATTFPDRVEAEVTNTGTVPVQGVVVRAATNTMRVGDLAPGAAEIVTIEADLPRTTQPHSDLFFELGANPNNGVIAPPRSMEATLRSSIMDGNPGLVWAVGRMATGGVEAVLTDGGPASDRGQLVAVGTQPALPPEGAISPFAVSRGVIPASAESYRPSPLAVEGPQDVYLRYRLPAGGSLPAGLHADLDRGQNFGGRLDLTIWHRPTRTWMPLADAFPGGGGGDPAALVSPLGEVWVRASGDLFPFEFSGRVISGVET